jgi:uncharacterized protein
VFALAAILLAPPATTLHSAYTLRWLAAALMLLAAIGRKNRRAAFAAAVIAGAGGLYIAGDAALTVARGASATRLCYVAGGLIVVAIAAQRLTMMRRRRRIDPVVMVSVQLAVGVVAYWLYYTLSGLGLDPRTYQADSVAHTAAIELGLLSLAFSAIGVGVYRTWRPAAQRLGWSMPRPWQAALAIVLALALGLSNIPLNLLMSAVMPHNQSAIAHISNHVFGGVPWWNLPLIAVMAGIGEETTFRGALQPRFGIIATAVLFALIHIQYGPTFVVLWVFVHGLIYGLVRRHINTTTAALTHATYDFSAFVSGPGFVVYCLVGGLMLIYLWRLSARNPQGTWDTLRTWVIEDWRALRQRSNFSG